MFRWALLIGAISVAALRPPPHLAANTVEDAHRQAGQKLRCFENNREGGVFLSEPIYTLCSYHVDPSGAEDGLVNGVSEESEDFAEALEFFERRATSKAAVLSLCSQEAYQLNEHKKSAVVTRCLCRRSGCNLPKSLTKYFNYNKEVLPQMA